MIFRRVVLLAATIFTSVDNVVLLATTEDNSGKNYVGESPPSSNSIMPAQTTTASVGAGLDAENTGKTVSDSSGAAAVVVQSPAVRRLMSVVRDKRTAQAEFVRYSNRVFRLLVEEALTLLPTFEKSIETACGVYPGVGSPMAERELCAVGSYTFFLRGRQRLQK